MSKNYLYIFLFIIVIKELSPKCVENENFCTRCHPLTNLCLKCQNEVLIPDEQGGCEGINKCFLGQNYCNNCNKEENLCEECEPGFFPDSNGGCSYTSNCEISYKGQCLVCKSDFILINEGLLSRCKYLKSDDLNNCKTVNTSNGICEECEDGFFLNKGDKKCTKVENCYESNFGKCQLCIEKYYLNKKEKKCIEKNNTQFINCKITADGEKCEECDENYFLSEDGNCLLTNFCKKSENDKCTECVDGYYLIKNGFCSLEENCEQIEIETGICQSCKNDYYLDFKGRKCLSNKEENNFKYCKFVLNECLECEKNYYLSENSVCSSTKYCSEAENGICISCRENYYLTLDNICTVIKDCIHSGNNEGCNECKDGLYYSFPERLCKKSEDNFINCRYSTWDQCDACKDNYYLLKPEKRCYNNTENNNFYKCKMSDKNGDYCAECEKGYYLTTGDDKICVKMIMDFVMIKIKKLVLIIIILKKKKILNILDVNILMKKEKFAKNVLKVILMKMENVLIKNIVKNFVRF